MDKQQLFDEMKTAVLEGEIEAAEEIARKALEMGEVAVQGPAKELMHDQRVIDTYLGVGGARAAA